MSVGGGARKQLDEIVERLNRGEDVEYPVRTLLSWFGASRRGYWITKSIREALEKAGLKTEPSFESVHPNALIRFDKPSEITGTSTVALADATLKASASVDANTNVEAATGAAFTDPTIRISQLEAATRKPISVNQGVTLSEAVTLMLLHDYSQIPVMNGERNVRGVISWTSIGTRFVNRHAAEKPENYAEKNTSWAGLFDGLRVDDLMDAAVEIADGMSIFDAIPVIVKSQYALVRNAHNLITGIVTSSDLGLHFRQLSEPYLLLGEIENYIRHMISKSDFSLEDLRAARDPRDNDRVVNSVADLTFREYIRLLERTENWNKVGLCIDKALFCKWLDEVRQIRNDVMHFEPDGVEDDDLEKLRRVAQMFQRLRQVGSL